MEKIARKTLIGDYNQGGMRMPDIELQAKGLKLAWLIRACELEGNWKYYLLNKLPGRYLNYFLRGGCLKAPPLGGR